MIIEQSKQIIGEVEKAFMGKREIVEKVLMTIYAGGHVLLEDCPGVGKTTLALAFSKALGLQNKRIQFTMDTLPSDITGFTMFNMKTGEQELHVGSIMNQIVLADEINRSSPKTQSALLEVMQENQVTIDGQTYPAPSPFMVLATQNPVEMAGTYPLPEAQMDRFFMRISMGYPTHDEEMRIVSGHDDRQHKVKLQPVASAQDVLDMQRELQSVSCSQPVVDYVVSIVAATREADEVLMGSSPRGSIALMQAARGAAMLAGRSFVLPDDVQKMAPHVLCHRMIMRNRAGLHRQTPESVIESILNSLPVPAVR